MSKRVSFTALHFICAWDLEMLLNVRNLNWSGSISIPFRLWPNGVCAPDACVGSRRIATVVESVRVLNTICLAIQESWDRA